MLIPHRLTQLPRDSRDTLFLLAVVAWLLLPHAANLPAWALLLAAAALGWRGWLAWQSRPLPGRRWLLIGLGLAMAGTFWSHKTLLGRDAGVTLVVALLALKTLEMRARRDAFVVFFLGFFTLLTHFFFSQSLPVALAMLPGLLGLLTALINAHRPVGPAPLGESAALALRMTALGAPVMLLLFLLFPRVAPLWGLPADAQNARSGLSPHMRVGDVTELALDDAIALRLRFVQPEDAAPPPQQTLYFRGPVLSVFDGREWKPRQPEDLINQVPRRRPPDSLVTRGPALRYEMTLEPNNRPWLLSLDATPAAPQLERGEAYATPELQWVASRPVGELLRYQASAYADFSYGPDSRQPALQPDTQLPAGFNPRTQQLAHELRQAARTSGADDAALVQQVLQRLARGGYRYTLEPGIYGRDTADEFWFDRKAGFCEHIASAFVVLMRGLDIPARVVTGYQGGERNPIDGYWVLRQSDAHAWAEVWLAGQGWVRVDPTGAVAPGRIGSLQRLRAPQGLVGAALVGVSPNLLQALRSAWDATNNRWNQWVLNYSQSRQLDLLRRLGFEAPSWEDLVLVLGGLLSAAALLSSGWQLWRRQRHEPWLRLLAQAQHLARRHGLAGPAVALAQTPRTLAQQALAQWGEAGRPFHDWLLQLEQARYARPAGPSHAAPLRELARRLRALDWPTASALSEAADRGAFLPLQGRTDHGQP